MRWSHWSVYTTPALKLVCVYRNMYIHMYLYIYIYIYIYSNIHIVLLYTTSWCVYIYIYRYIYVIQYCKDGCGSNPSLIVWWSFSDECICMDDWMCLKLGSSFLSQWQAASSDHGHIRIISCGVEAPRLDWNLEFLSIEMSKLDSAHISRTLCFSVRQEWDFLLISHKFPGIPMDFWRDFP